MYVPALPGLQYALFTAATFMVFAAQLAFWPLWLSARGLDAAEIGALSAATLMVRVATMPLLALLTYRVDSRRLIVALSLAMLAGFVLFVPAHGFLAILPISVPTGVCLAALPPLTDSAVLRAGLDYGRVRLWGTLSFLVMTLAIGRAMLDAPTDRLLIFVLGSGAAVVAASLLLPRSTVRLSVVPGGGWRMLLDRRHALFFLAVTLIQSSHAAHNQFSALYWRSLGYGTDAIGWLWADTCIAEMLLFYWGRALVKRLSPVALLTIGAYAGLVRWTVLGTSASLPLLIGAQALHCLTFAAAHLGALNYLLRHVPPAHASAAQLAYSAALAIGFGLASLLAGGLYQEIGGSAAFLAMAAMAGVGGLAAQQLARLPRSAAASAG